LGAYYAKKSGLPVEKLLVASNINNILTELIDSGVYDMQSRDLIKTDSPAMVILKSSNVERVLFDKFGAERTKELMESLNSRGKYTLTGAELISMQDDFEATYSEDYECEASIAKYASHGYIMDPHTATCMKSYEERRKKELKTIVYSTAEWTKFSTTVARALGSDEVNNDTQALQWIAQNTDESVPPMIEGLFTKDVKHGKVVEKEFIKDEMLKFL
jgi:threonine synthase